MYKSIQKEGLDIQYKLSYIIYRRYILYLIQEGDMHVNSRRAGARAG